MTELGAKTDKPLTFAEMSEADDNLLHNSNMLNLVSAAKKATGYAAEMRAEAARLDKLVAEIKTFADDPSNLQNTTEVARLFEEVKPQELRTKRW